MKNEEPKENPMTCERLFRDDAYLKSCAARVVARSERGIELDRTVFYPRGGGQPGDTGGLRRADGVAVRVIDARQGEGPASVVHVPEPGVLVANGRKVGIRPS